MPNLRCGTREGEIFHAVPRGTREGEILHEVPRRTRKGENFHEKFHPRYLMKTFTFTSSARYLIRYLAELVMVTNSQW